MPRQGSWLRRRAVALVLVAVLAGLLPAAPATADPQQLAAPATVTVSQRSTMAVVAWPPVVGAAGYAIDYDTSPGFVTARNLTSPGTLAVLTGLDPSTSYYVRVAAVDGATSTIGHWAPASTFATRSREYSLPPPVLTASSDTSTSLTVAWKKVGSDLDYEVALGKDATTVSSTQQVAKGLSASFRKLDKTTKYYLSARALDAAGNPVTAWSAPMAYSTPESLPLRIGSYNIMCENCSKGKATWAKRRGPLVASIKAQDLDVLGVQEASIGRIPGGGSQYMDLINRLGSSYKLTEYGRGTSPDVRIIYNAERVRLVDQGVVALPRGASRRFLAWAILEQKSTGKTFFYTSTHLEPKDGRKAWNTRKRQTQAIVAATRRLSRNLPVISVGDYASTKWEKWGNAPYDVMQAAGYRDPLGNAFRSRDSAPGAFVEKRINTTYSSYNMYKRSGRNFAGDLHGSHNDYIFTSEMRVSEYEVVVKVDGSGRLTGVIPSDHNMLRATVYLP